ncbi:MAG: HlyD family efflux transporter periplasmic adaptor subunit [Patescibacteria group bacterium]
MFARLASKPVLFAVLAVLLVIVGTLVWGGSAEETTGYTVKRRNLERFVTFSGTVVPRERVELAFERSGRISRINVSVGDTVKRGASIATLVADNAYAALQQQEAVIRTKEADLAALRRGSRPEEVAVKSAEYENAVQSSAETEKALRDELNDAFATADTELHHTIDQLFDSPRTLPHLKYPGPDSNLDARIRSERLELEDLMKSWRADVQAIQSNALFSQTFNRTASVAALAVVATEPSLEEMTDKTRDRLARLFEFTNVLSTYIHSVTENAALTEQALEDHRTGIAAARAAITTATSALNTARKNNADARALVVVRKASLRVAEVGASAEDIRAQEARIDAERARARELAGELRKYTISAPFESVVIERLVEQGEISTAGAHAFTLDSTGHLEIEARVSELDIISIKPDATAEVTIDAFGDDVAFSAHVSHVDPAEVDVDGVRGYGVSLILDPVKDTVVRAGMTANVLIHTIEREQVLAVPSGYIRREAGKAFVQIEGRDTETEVFLSASVPGELIEITSGVSEGDVLTLYTIYR